MSKRTIQIGNKHEKKLEVIYDDYFNESKVKYQKYFLVKYKAEFNVSPFIPHDVREKIQQVGIIYGLFSQIMNIKGAVVVEVEKTSKEFF